MKCSKYILFILISILSSEKLSALPAVFVKELVNSSKFDARNDVWKIENKLTEWLVEELSSTGKYKVIREKLACKNRALGSKNCLIEGKVTEFDLGAAALDAYCFEYMNYYAKVKIELECSYYLSDGTKTFTVIGSGEDKNQKIRPFYSHLVPEKDDQSNEMVTDFKTRNQVKWGDSSFNTSVVGKSCRQAIMELVNDFNLLESNFVR
ncbi:MAG: hypothetical protein KKH91_05890 [Elusimicrobia bacterium]|nr:hypothetical protein [Elusimicrobiota bacterium]